MNDATRCRKALQRIRRLSCLDIGGPQLAPLLMQELRDVLFFDTAGYFWTGPEGKVDLFMEDPAVTDILPLYLDPYIQKAEREAGRSFDECLNEDFGPIQTDQMIKLPMKKFMRHDYYNLVLRPVELNHCMSLVPRINGGRGYGSLKLYRRNPRHAFTQDEARVFGAQEGLFAEILNESTHVTEQDLVNDAMLVATLDGKLQWISDQARHLLHLAFSSRWNEHSSLLPAMITTLLRRIEHLRSGRESSLPHTEVITPHGKFVFKARLMLSMDSHENTVGIRIEHQRPRPLRVLETLREMAIPQQQAETFYWLSRGLSEQDIAQRMEISSNTVVYHRRQLYARFGAANRQELIQHLKQHMQKNAGPAVA